MSSALSERVRFQEPSVFDRPVQVEVGYLGREVDLLKRLGSTARALADGVHPSGKRFDELRNGVANLSASIEMGNQFANFDVMVGPPKSRLLFSCSVVADEMPPALPRGDITDRLYDAAAATLTTTRDIARTAGTQFRTLETEAAQTSLPWRDMFQIYVADNTILPVNHRERTIALAYAHAALIVHDYEPALHPKKTLQQVAVHADRAIGSIAKYCGTGRGINPDRQVVDPSKLKEYLVDAIAWTTEANTLSAKFSKRYGLALAEDMLNRPRTLAARVT